MSRVQYSFDAQLAALAAKPEGRRPRARTQATLSARRPWKSAIETLGLFAFGFGSTSLLIHVAAGFFLATRMSSLLALATI